MWLPKKLLIHDKTSSLVKLRPIKSLCPIKWHFFSKFSILSRCYLSTVITTPSLSYIKILGVWVQYCLRRKSFMKVGIRGGCTKIQVTLVNHTTRAMYKTCRITTIWYGLFIFNKNVLYRKSSLFINLLILFFMCLFNGNSTYYQLPTI